MTFGGSPVRTHTGLKPTEVDGAQAKELGSHNKRGPPQEKWNEERGRTRLPELTELVESINYILQDYISSIKSNIPLDITNYYPHFYEVNTSFSFSFSLF